MKILETTNPPRLFYTTVWADQPKIRTLVFLYKDATGRIIVRPVTDTDVPVLREAPQDAPKDRKSAGH